MSGLVRTSRLRLIAGLTLLGVTLIIATFILPDAAQQKIRKQNASDEAKKLFAMEIERLAALEREDKRLALNRARLENLLGSMSDQSVGQLQWQLSRRLHHLAQKHSVRLQSLKYGAPTREESKGTDLEVLNVDFTATGIYQNLKPFMLALEDSRESKLPFAVASAKLEESSDGARLSVILRAFRRSGTAGTEAGKGGT